MYFTFLSQQQLILAFLVNVEVFFLLNVFLNVRIEIYVINKS